MRILVTGGSGFIGRQCITGLADSGHEVFGVYTRNSPVIHPCTWLQANLLDESARISVLERVRPDVLVHLAWQADDYDDGVHLDWLAASLHLVRCFQQQGGKFLFTAGSSMEYAWEGEVCSESRSRFNSSTLYGHAKHALWKTVSEYCSRESLAYCHGRIFFLYGPGQDRTRLVPAIVHSLLENKPFVCKSGHLYRDYLDVREVAAAINNLVLSECDGDFNIASGIATKIEDIVKQILARIDKTELVEFELAPVDESKDLKVVGEVEKIEAAIGCRPSFNLEKTINETIDWIEHNPTA
jgi:nucleoside-diphosphate-sugar epimerase